MGAVSGGLSQRSNFEMNNCTTIKEKQLARRKYLYARLAYCLRTELRFWAIGSPHARRYQEEAKSVRLELRGGLEKKPYPPLMKYFVFYPTASGWTKGEFWSSRPVVRTVGIQDLVDHLLKRQERLAA